MEYRRTMALLEGPQQVVVQPPSGSLAQDTGGNGNRETSSGRCALGLNVDWRAGPASTKAAINRIIGKHVYPGPLFIPFIWRGQRLRNKH